MGKIYAKTCIQFEILNQTGLLSCLLWNQWWATFNCWERR